MSAFRVYCEKIIYVNMALAVLSTISVWNLCLLLLKLAFVNSQNQKLAPNMHKYAICSRKLLSLRSTNIAARASVTITMSKDNFKFFVESDLVKCLI